MRPLAMSLAVSLAGSVASAASVPTPGDVQFTMPAEFQGEWNGNLEHCRTGLNDSRLRIAATALEFYESGGPVKAVVRRGSFEIIVVAELSGEGQSWLASNHFILSSDSSYIISRGAGGSDLIRYRCPQ